MSEGSSSPVEMWLSASCLMTLEQTTTDFLDNNQSKTAGMPH